MAQQVQHGRDDEHDRRAPRLAALVVVSMATGLAAALLAARGGRIAQSLPTPRVEVHLEILVLAVGAVLAAWVALTSALALVCVVAQALGRRWDTGERLVLRHAPAAVRRLASIGVSLSVGAGLALGGGAAQAAELPPVPEGSTNGSLVVDLGWQPTPQTDSSVDDAGHMPAVGPAAGPSASDPLAVPAPSSGPAPTGAAPRSPSPTSGPSAEPTPHAAAQPPASTAPVPTVREPPPADSPEEPEHSTPRPAHVPLGTLLGSPARAATPSPATASDPAAPAPSVVEIVVLRGDTLWSLAERRLGSEASDAQVAAECRRWFGANRDVIGDDPDLIKPGQILSAPPSP
ncbi:LysM peptidoglycan-binding domain-containing protein [Oerskovia sp. Root22]|uniref:LysM peptidoglycan-binding domain-containing protein n=1 Tax=Oerskovia sp. Root22 TaxID=1736494 RepID=UPI00070199DB|nr:hypothetical protein [Oerskovia sp. Root22]KRC34138.1 hypothetical protein ASE15_13160 [Oerskovia sp. Root22]